MVDLVKMKQGSCLLHKQTTALRYSHLGYFGTLHGLDTLILTIATRATTGTGQGVPETFTVLANAPIILAGATLTDFLYTSLKGVWALVEGRLDGVFSISTDIFIRIQATHTRADAFLARLLLMETGAVELETSRANTVTRNFPRRKLLGL
jgi:hypothetical protein